MKIAQAGLLIVVGLGILWLAVTGRFDRIGSAFAHIVQGEALPRSSGLDVEGAVKDYIEKQGGVAPRGTPPTVPPIANLDAFVSPVAL